MKKSKSSGNDTLFFKLLGAFLILSAGLYAAWYFNRKPVLPATLEVTTEKLVLTNEGDLPWEKVEVYLNHPLKGLRQIVPLVKGRESVLMEWDDFKQVYEGGDFDKGPVFMIWILVDGFKPRKFEPDA